MKIVMTSPVMEVVEVKGKTKAKMFENLKVGDKVEFSIPIKYAGMNGGTYASYIKCKNVESGEVTFNSFNQLPSRLSNFEFKEV